MGTNPKYKLTNPDELFSLLKSSVEFKTLLVRGSLAIRYENGKRIGPSWSQLELIDPNDGRRYGIYRATLVHSYDMELALYPSDWTGPVAIERQRGLENAATFIGGLSMGTIRDLIANQPDSEAIPRGLLISWRPDRFKSDADIRYERERAREPLPGKGTMSAKPSVQYQDEYAPEPPKPQFRKRALTPKKGLRDFWSLGIQYDAYSATFSDDALIPASLLKRELTVEVPYHETTQSLGVLRAPWYAEIVYDRTGAPHQIQLLGGKWNVQSHANDEQLTAGNILCLFAELGDDSLTGSPGAEMRVLCQIHVEMPPSVVSSYMDSFRAQVLETAKPLTVNDVISVLRTLFRRRNVPEITIQYDVKRKSPQVGGNPVIIGSTIIAYKQAT